MVNRAENEIKHGQFLGAGDPETIWGWGSPAGRVRARRRADLISKGAGLVPGLKVLEIGCGTGLFTEMFAQSGCYLAAVDISSHLLEKARSRALPQDRVCFLNKRFEECGTMGPFDAVIGSSILHHLDIEQALLRIFELLKPSGVLSFAEPNYLNPQVFAERTFRRLFPSVSPNETAFVRRVLARRLRQAGFEDITIAPFDWLHPAVPGPLIGLVSTLGAVLEKMPLLREFSGSLYIRATRPRN